MNAVKLRINTTSRLSSHLPVHTPASLPSFLWTVSRSEIFIKLFNMELLNSLKRLRFLDDNYKPGEDIRELSAVTRSA